MSSRTNVYVSIQSNTFEFSKFTCSLTDEQLKLLPLGTYTGNEAMTAFQVVPHSIPELLLPNNILMVAYSHIISTNTNADNLISLDTLSTDNLTITLSEI